MNNIKSTIFRPPSILLIVLLVFGVQHAFSQNTIRVDQGKIYSSCNEEIVMRGVNEMFVWSQDRTGVSILPEIAKTGSNAVRLVWTTEGAEAELDALINNSIKNNMIPVAELHDATGDFSKLQMLLDYWKKPAVLSTIQKYKKWLIVNIGNEVGNGSESTAQWVDYYKDAITQLRDAGIDGPLMIDCGGYGNRESYFLEGGNELLEFDPKHNIIFAVHTYWTNGDDQAKVDRLNTMIEDAKLKKLPYIIGEGPQVVASPVACGQSFPYKEMMKRLQEEKIGWLSWSWGAVNNNDCGSPNSKLDITSDGKFGSWATTFAEEMCITDINSIKNTSIIPESLIDGSIAACGTTYTITAFADAGGSISPSGQVIVSENDNQIFDITTTIGFKIKDVLVDGISVGNVASYTFSNVLANHTIRVMYDTVPLPPQVPYLNGVPQVIPGKIKATSFDLGGEAVAYHDISSGNEGNGIRQEEDVDTENAGDGGSIGFTAVEEWMEYTVDIAQAGTYSIDVLVASQNSNGQFHIEFDGKDVTGIQNVNGTGSWTSFVPQKISNVTLSAGEQVMRMYIDNGAFNFSTMTFTRDGNTGETPTASFTATPETGVSPLEVSFDASASSDPNGDAITYSWDFGNGETSTLATPKVTFTEIKTYTVTLTVSDGTNISTPVTKDIVVSDGNIAPVADFTATPTTGIATINVSFDATASTDANGDTLTYAWDFGDGTTGTGITVDHLYAAIGEYTATLTVSDGSKTGTKTTTITVTNGSPVASFTASAETGVAPLAVSFDASGSSDPAGGVLTYSWDFGNGEVATTATASTTYTTLGQVTVTLTVTNDAGNTASATKTINVTDGSVSCAFGTPISGGLPSVSNSFENVFVLGENGPNLDNVTKFIVNWDLANNGLYEFSISTNNGTPTWYTNLLPKVTQNFNAAEPAITITDSGFAGLDGEYWATIDAGNFVLVSKTGGFTLYFSTSATVPDCGTTPTPVVVDGGVIAGGPFTFTVGDGIADNVSGVTITGNIGDTSQWIVTDAAGKILGLPASPEAVDFDGAGVGSCFIYNVSYNGTITGLTANENISGLVGTFDLSNSIEVVRNPVTTGGDCSFGAPLGNALPALNSKYENIFVLGSGGPNLDNVTNLTINWDLANNGLYQFSMNTNNGTPSWYNDFLPKVTQTFNAAQPSLTITGSGFTGLDGEYWATEDSGNFVLVSKTGGFTIYFSTTAIAPDCGGVSTTSLQDKSNIVVSPNPASSHINVSIDNNIEAKSRNNVIDVRIAIFDLVGNVVKVKNIQNRQQQLEAKISVEELTSGLYILETFDRVSKRKYQSKILINR
ncbi:PKD domain-containing protein [Aquimarina algiphila]|nr:PKD domain-containing protein [Aquimarina algiphila]